MTGDCCRIGNRHGSAILRQFLWRFLTADPYVAGGAAKGSVGSPKDPGSWNRYAYVEGDPVNRLDPAGTSYIDVSPYGPEGISGSCFGIDVPTGCTASLIVPNPNINCYGPVYVPPEPPMSLCGSSSQTSFVLKYYGQVAAEAAAIQLMVASTGAQANQENFTVAFLDWSADESKWGASNAASLNNNFFGGNPGSYGGTALPSSSCADQNFACWGSSVTRGQELSDILNFVPTSTNNPNIGQTTYGAFVALAMINNPNASLQQIIQTIANAGFNSANPNYAGDAAKYNAGGIADCLMAEGYIRH